MCVASNLWREDPVGFPVWFVHLEVSLEMRSRPSVISFHIFFWSPCSNYLDWYHRAKFCSSLIFSCTFFLLTSSLSVTFGGDNNALSLNASMRATHAPSDRQRKGRPKQSKIGTRGHTLPMPCLYPVRPFACKASLIRKRQCLTNSDFLAVISWTDRSVVNRYTYISRVTVVDGEYSEKKKKLHVIG